MSTEETNIAATDALWRLAETDRIDLVDSLLEAGADINASNEHGMTALMRAAANGRTQMVSILLTHGANPNLSRNDKFTPLLLASFFGHEEIVKLLVEHRADTSAKSRFETSAQMWASCRNFFDVADYLEHPLTSTEVPEVSDIAAKEPAAQLENEISPAPLQIAEPAERLELAEIRDVESIAVHGRQPVTSRSSLKWAFAGFVSAFLLVAMVVLTDRAMQRDDHLKLVPAQKQSPVITQDYSRSSQSVSDVNLPNTKPVVNDIDEGSSLLKNQDELKPKRVARGVLSIADSTATPKFEQKNMSTKVSLPERTEAEERPTESPANVRKQPATRDRTATTLPAPSHTQLLTGANGGPPTGKVIRWP